MKLIFPVFGVLLASASCCCFGSDDPFADFDGPRPVEPGPIEVPPIPPPVVPDGASMPTLPDASGAPGPMPEVPPSEQPDTTQPATPSTPTTPTTPTSPVSSTPAAAASGTHEGTLTTGSSTLVVLHTTGGQVPPVGATGALSKWVSKKMFGADVTMWLNIANVSVTAVDSSSVTLSVKEVTFDATVNGQKVDPFEKGVKTQLEWVK